jgi:hypothetical protein
MRQLTTILIVIFFLTTSFAGDGSPSPDELLTSLRAGNAKLLQAEQSLKSYQCKFKTSVQTLDPKTDKTDTKESTKFLQIYKKDNKLCYHIERTELSPGSRGNTDETIGVLTDKSMFVITRQDPHGEWVLAKFSNKDYEKDFWASFTQRDYLFHPFVALSQSLLMTDFLANPSFRLSEVRTRPDGRIEAKYSAEWGHETKKDTKFAQKGTIVFEPKFNFAVTETSCTHAILRSGGRPSEKPIHFSRTFDESGWCRTIQYKYGNEASSSVQDIFIELVDNSSVSFSDEVFSLDFYKIPHPVDIDAQPIPFYFRTTFWICACVGCLLLAIVFWWLARSRRSAQ